MCFVHHYIITTNRQPASWFKLNSIRLEYMQEQVSNIFQEINCLRTRPNNSQYIHAADVHRDEPREIQVVPQPTPKDPNLL
jgi:hypothetical protein